VTVSDWDNESRESEKTMKKAIEDTLCGTKEEDVEVGNRKCKVPATEVLKWNLPGMGAILVVFLASVVAGSIYPISAIIYGEFVVVSSVHRDIE